MQEGKDPLLFEIWVFRNNQPDRDDDRIIQIHLPSSYRSARIFKLFLVHHILFAKYRHKII